MHQVPEEDINLNHVNSHVKRDKCTGTLVS